MGNSGKHGPDPRQWRLVLSYGREQRISLMKDQNGREVPDFETQERQRRRDLRRALTFGIVMATIQMGILLYFMYC